MQQRCQSWGEQPLGHHRRDRKGVTQAAQEEGTRGLWVSSVCRGGGLRGWAPAKVQGRLLPTPMYSCHVHMGTIPVKHTGHLKVPPMPSKLCSMRWQRSLAGESNIWLHSLHSWLMPSSARESDNFSETHTGATSTKTPYTSPMTSTSAPGHPAFLIT